MFSAGCFLNKNIYNGALRHASIALKMFALYDFFSFITIQLLRSIFINNDLATVENLNIISFGVALVFSPFCYAAYFCLYRAFHKLPKYPV